MSEYIGVLSIILVLALGSAVMLTAALIMLGRAINLVWSANRRMALADRKHAVAMRTMHTTVQAVAERMEADRV